MALQLVNYVSPQGVPAPAAYARIMQMIVTKTSVRINLSIFFNKDSAPTTVKPNAPALDKLVFVLPLTTNPIWTDVYTALKALPLFAGATDV